MAGRRLHFFFDQLPPSENRITVHRWGGGEAYSAAALAYRRQFFDFAGNKLKHELQLFMREHTRNTLYCLTFVFCFPATQILNKGWPRSTENRYKRNDASNRKKLLEDSLVLLLGGSAAGMDDSLFFEVNLIKYLQEPSGVWITLEEADPTTYGITTGISSV